MKLTRRHLLVCSPLALLLAAGYQAAQRASAPAGDPLIEGFKKTTVASVADAVDQVVGRRGFMAHDVRPQVPGAFVGRATPAVVGGAPPEMATAALSARHSIQMIDNARPGQVGVIVIEQSLDVAALGGLMGATAKARGMAGMVVDGSVRDLAELRALPLPVYARGVVPSSSVGRWASVARDIPVECAGVTVRPGDIIVAGEDGVVVVPAEKAEAVLKRAREIDERESKMVPLIKQYKSLQKVVEMFNRI
jgi:4-hydroxy-4-methyl-2-oxoglutarate aldolase